MNKRRNKYSAQSMELHTAIRRLNELYGLSVIKEDSRTYGLVVLAQNEVAGVQFEFIPQDQPGWRALVGRLVEGKFPIDPIMIDRQTPLHHFDLMDYVALRGGVIDSDLAEQLGSRRPLSASDICGLIEKFCFDVLQGDWSLFPQLTELVMSRLPPLRPPER